MKFKFTKNKVIEAALTVIFLAAAFWYGGGAPGLRGWSTSPSWASNEAYADKPDDKESEEIQSIPDIEQTENASDDEPAVELGLAEVYDASETDIAEKPAGELDSRAAASPDEDAESRTGGIEGGMSASDKIDLAKDMADGASSPGVEKESKSYSEAQGMIIDAATGKDKYMTNPVPEGKPVPVEPQSVEISDVEYKCTISVRCDTILDNIDWLDTEKVELVPEEGVILPATEVTFYEGESVFNVLQREMKKAKIHMEFENTPMYNSVYIEGINNLYEFDCGELSGWMYKVNGWFPNYGCSRYGLKDGDVIEWVYTCDLGVDVGGFYATAGE